MPTYEYKCTTCGHRFDYFQSISSDPLVHCPHNECIQEEEEKKGTGDVVRLVSGGAGLVFKGEGFYLTDYVRKGEKGSGGSSSDSGSGAGSGSGKSSEGSKGSSSSGSASSATDASKS